MRKQTSTAIESKPTDNKPWLSGPFIKAQKNENDKRTEQEVQKDYQENFFNKPCPITNPSAHLENPLLLTTKDVTLSVDKFKELMSESRTWFGTISENDKHVRYQIGQPSAVLQLDKQTQQISTVISLDQGEDTGELFRQEQQLKYSFELMHKLGAKNVNLAGNVEDLDPIQIKQLREVSTQFEMNFKHTETALSQAEQKVKQNNPTVTPVPPAENHAQISQQAELKKQTIESLGKDSKAMPIDQTKQTFDQILIEAFNKRKLKVEVKPHNPDLSYDEYEISKDTSKDGNDKIVMHRDKSSGQLSMLLNADASKPQVENLINAVKSTGGSAIRLGGEVTLSTSAFRNLLDECKKEGIQFNYDKKQLPEAYQEIANQYPKTAICTTPAEAKAETSQRLTPRWKDAPPLEPSAIPGGFADTTPTVPATPPSSAIR